MFIAILLATVLLETGQNGISLKLESADQPVVDPARSLFLTLTLETPHNVRAELPDLRGRVRGFAVAEDFEAEPVRRSDGGLIRKAEWKLVPEPVAERYGIAPFAVHASPALLSSADDDGKLSFIAGPVNFEPPPAPEIVTGDFEVEAEKDLPPLSWRLVGWCAIIVTLAAAALAGIWFAVRMIVRKVKEHRMSPIERARVELDRLLQKGLPGRGKFKDFYVELTLVVRRYIQRRYGVRAPHLTTEEFLREIGGDGRFENTAALREFLESADMIKFAGVAATPESADAATKTAEKYLEKESAKKEGLK